MNHKTIPVMLTVVMMLSSCRKFTPERSSVAAGAYSDLRGSVTSIVASRHPNIEAVVKIEGLATGGVFQSITDFKKGDFAVTENNSPVVIEQLSYSREPISAILVLDSSGSMYGTPIDDLKTAVTAFINGLLGIDEVEIIEFDTELTITPFTSTKSDLLAGINNMVASGGTALWDATSRALDDILNATNPNKLLIVMTDGIDGSSTTTYLDVRDKALAIDQEINCIGYSDLYDHLLQSLAEETGGTFHSTTSSGDLITIYTDYIPTEINQTILHYRTREKGSKKVEIYLNYGSFSEYFSSQYES
ncbi:MAG: VWA domain-containing protein [Elusimicrobia bacterium]|nr:VWA domain-containing protein [Elusimicrobiota bacterium]MBD3412310.1 VWA domain-containing protein [Elusimicrobiota bacterium]